MSSGSLIVTVGTNYSRAAGTTAGCLPPNHEVVQLRGPSTDLGLTAATAGVDEPYRTRAVAVSKLRMLRRWRWLRRWARRGRSRVDGRFRTLGRRAHVHESR